MKIIKEYSQWLNENFNITNSMFEWKAPTTSAQGVFQTYAAGDTTDNDNGLSLAELADFEKTGPGILFKTFENDFKNAGGVSAQQILASLLAGSVKKKWLLGLIPRRENAIISQAIGLVKNRTVSINYESEGFKYNYVGASGGTQVLTRGQVAGPYSLSNKPENGKSNLTNLLSFVNTHNINAYALNLPQYCLLARVEPPTQIEGEQQGFIDLEREPGAYSQYEVGGESSPGILYIYSTKVYLPQSGVGFSQSDDKSTGGQEAIVSNYETDFEPGKSDCTTPKVVFAVKKAAHQIARIWPAGKGPDTFKLTSGASADWNKKPLPESTGTGKNFTGKTQDEIANQTLAYNRGFNFMTAVNAELAKMKHPGFPKFEVNWVIGNTGGPATAPNGKYVDLMLEKQAVQPTVTTVTKYVSRVVGSKSTGASAGTLYEFKLSITGATKVGTPALPNQ